ncbi:hypothetical protein LG302_05490 [Halomonas organivorans]
MALPDHPLMTTPLLPQELLTLALDHERQEMHRYRRLAFLFLTFGRGISPLMAVLGVESEKRLAELHRVACDLDPVPATLEPPVSTSPAPGEMLHLIHHRGQAVAMLKRAEAQAEHALRVTEHLQRCNVIPALASLLPGQLAQKQAERHILQELIAAYDGEFSRDGQLASRPWPRGWLSCARRLHGLPAG